jgi:4-amino-4-deoxychorismate lyase
VLAADAAALTAGADNAVLRLTLTRGQGSRGYRPPVPTAPTRILALYPASPHDPMCPEPTALTLCRTPVSASPLLAGIKHLNRLEQVMARAEWDDDAILDGIMTDDRGCAICGTMTNLFAVDERGIRTPRLERCGVAGTVRALVLRKAADSGIPVEVTDLKVADITAANGLFITNALLGAVPVGRFLDRRFDAGALPLALLEQVRAAAFSPETVV